MKRLTGLCALWLLAAASSPAANEFSNRRAPGFSLPDTTGKQHDIADYRGKILLLDIMQVACPHCKVLTGILEKVKAKYGSKVAVLSIVVLPDTLPQVLEYIKEHKVTSPILFDCGQATASYLRITPQNPSVKFPHLFFIDEQGVIRFDHGARYSDSKEVLEGNGVYTILDSMLKPKPAAAPRKK